MDRKTDHVQLARPGFEGQSCTSLRKSIKSRIRRLQWPPRIGQKIAFESPCGVETGVVRQIRWGLVWREYIVRDGKILAEDDLIMRPEDTLWRDPRSVNQAEVAACVERIKAFHALHPDVDPTQVPNVWSDICQLMAHFALKSRIERERKEAALMEIKASIPPA
jgi:hypothetical protein